MGRKRNLIIFKFYQKWDTLRTLKARLNLVKKLDIKRRVKIRQNKQQNKILIN